MASLDLVFPPLTGVSYPYLSTAALTAYVRQESDHRVQQHDLNYKVVDWLLRPTTVSRWIERAERCIAADAGRTLDGRDAFRFAQCADLVMKGPAILELLPKALEVVRSTSGIAHPGEVAAADRIVAAALAAARVGSPPEAFNLVEPIYRYSASSPGELRRGLEDEENPFYRIYDELIAPHDLRADVVGISVIYHGQVYPALSLARWLRHRNPHTKILMGGPIFTVHRERLKCHAWLFDWVDAFAIYEGESPLVGYLDALARPRRSLLGHPLDGVPGLIWRAPDGVHETGAPTPIDVNRLPCPDFDGLPVSDYHMPEPVLPLLASRGCYWRCAFCTHHYIYGESYRVRSPERINTDLQILRERYGSRHIYFVDESMSPKLLRHISNALLDVRSDVRWGCELRTERNLSREDLEKAFASGCRVFSFGVESANQRVLDLMEKGITVPEIDRIIEQAADAGIHNHVMCIVGFPGEEEHEAEDTLRFVARHRDDIDLVGFSFFYLLRHSPVERSPRTYSVREMRELRHGYDFEERLAYEVESGIDQETAFALWQRMSGTPDVALIGARSGHAQRERLLFSPGRAGLGRLRAQGLPTPLRDAIRNLPAELRAFGHDLEAATNVSTPFLLEAGRAYNCHGTALEESWTQFGLAHSLPPLAQPALYVFLPDRWAFLRLESATARVLLRLHRGDTEERILAEARGTAREDLSRRIELLRSFNLAG
ncbi:radical SAM protein [Sorangium sp. So ce367]|uniref:B12-binding domain-containing radical SAM protein n=1 Tax=Sorangium sp. So ce367 TaxID=3133305 RepID=UPI003F645BDF